MKFLIVTPDGLGIRNFLCGRFIELLLSKGEVVVWHSFSDTTLAPHRERWGDAVRWELLPTFREGLAARVLRQAKIYAQLYWRYEEDNSDVALTFLRPSGRLANQTVAFIARWLGRSLSTARGLRWLDDQHARATLRANYLKRFEDVLARERPDVLFCTHQRSSRAVPAMLAARSMGIPTATFIYSWDNLPKGRMAVHADHFLVWSDLMKQELLCYYPEVASDRVHVVGTPQFEHYFNRSLVQPRKQFLTSLGLDASRPVVCFSGDDLTSSPHDPVYLADLAGALRKIPATERPQILFRRCPVDMSDRYSRVLDEYLEIAKSDPLWFSSETNDWSQMIPTIGDVALLTNVVQHSDLVVNVGSTMAVDFAVFGKPAIYIAYNPPSANGSWNIHDSYRFPHLRSVHELQPVYWAESAEKLAGLVMHALSNPEEKLQARSQWMNRLVAHPLDQASSRCYEALEKIISSSCN
jgi:hypothetical protein